MSCWKPQTSIMFYEARSAGPLNRELCRAQRDSQRDSSNGRDTDGDRSRRWDVLKKWEPFTTGHCQAQHPSFTTDVIQQNRDEGNRYSNAYTYIHVPCWLCPNAAHIVVQPTNPTPLLKILMNQLFSHMTAVQLGPCLIAPALTFLVWHSVTQSVFLSCIPTLRAVGAACEGGGGGRTEGASERTIERDWWGCKTSSNYSVSIPHAGLADG